jgi:hypothetical protein
MTATSTASKVGSRMSDHASGLNFEITIHLTVSISCAEENCGCDGGEVDGGADMAGESLFPILGDGLTSLLCACASVSRVCSSYPILEGGEKCRFGLFSPFGERLKSFHGHRCCLTSAFTH